VEGIGTSWRGGGVLGGAMDVLHVYWDCLCDTGGRNGVIAERVGSDGTASLTVAKRIRPWCPDRLIALYGRGDDDDEQREGARSSDSQETGVPTTSFCTECLGRAKPSLPLMDARGARIGWYLSRRAAKVQKAKATRHSRFRPRDPNRHGGAVPCA